MKMKKLLASALAAAMVVSSMIGTMVTSAATTVGTITAGTVNAVVGETDTITADINIAFPDGVVAPHNIISVALEGYNLSDVALGTVTYADGSAAGVVSIDADGSNLAAGKILLEAPVDSKAPTVTAIALTATFVDADDVDTVAGTYAIVVNGDDMTDVNEAEIAISAVNGALVVAAPHVCTAGAATANGDGTHDIACAGCDKLFADNAACTYVDGVCSVCGYAEPVTGPAVDSKLVVAGAAVGFADSSLQVNFRIRKTVIQLYSKVELVIIPQKYDTTTYNLVAEPVEIVPTLTAAGNFYTFAYTDIQLFELGLGIDYMLRAYDAEGNLVAVSNDFSVVPADYLKTLYTTSDALMKTLITDTLVVGAEAAIMFSAGKEDSDLAKASSIIEGFDLSAATQTIGTMNTVDDFNSYDSKYGNKSSNTYYAAKSAGIGKAANLTYRLRDRQALDVAKFEFKVTYNSVKLSGKTEVYSKTFTSADANAKVARGGQFVTFAFDEVSFCDSDKDILVEVYYDGAKVYDMTYSIETYFDANLSNATTGGTITALTKLGISARAVAASKQ